MPSSPIPIPRSLFKKGTVHIAKALLSQQLWVKSNDEYLKYRIVETEAYTQDDPACHAYQKNKGRAATLYKAPGLAYVYLIYGMYHCLNVVTEPEGTAGAVLFRGIEPLRSDYPDHTHGPGRLTKTLNITKAHNEISMIKPDSPLLLVQDKPVAEDQITTTTRIGITKATDYPWRFYITGNKYVSVKAKTPTKQ